MLARIAMRAVDEGRVALMPANDIGYFGAYDSVLFSGSPRQMWTGCMAGVNALASTI